jgi:hypothetical protein
MSNQLQFRIRSAGTISIALERCAECPTRACLAVCESQDGPLVWDEGRRGPALRWSEAEVERGGCVECLGCELDCTLFGRQAVSIHLPLPRMEEYLGALTEPVVYAR